MTEKTDTLVLTVRFEGVSEKKQPPPTVAYAFDSTGKYLASALVEKDKAELELPESSFGRTIKCLFGPEVEEPETIKISELRRKGAYERRLRVDPETRVADVRLLEPDWTRWLYCPCVVRGRVVVRVPLPNGTVREMPVCHTRVTICEVDRLPRIIMRLPEKYLYRLRDELLHVVREPSPLPDPIPDWLKPALLGPQLEPPDVPWMGADVLGYRIAHPVPEPPDIPQRVEPLMARIDTNTLTRIQTVAMSHTATELRQNLIAVSDLIYPYLCLWAWFDIFFRYVKHCFRTVMVDENGEFETTIWYPCGGDKPDLYFEAEQWQGGVWKTVYEPSVRCYTYWNYECGTQVTLVVTDPSVVPCEPDPDVDVPPGVITWIMPYQVGRTEIWGTPPGSPTPLPAGPGWVKPNGTTDYGGLTDAPFGDYLGFTQGHSNDIPNGGIKYFRWSYRLAGTTSLNYMQEPVVRHYVKQSPGELPSFPTYPLGHHTMGGNQYLYEFKPPSPPPPDPGDPPGTITYWPTNNFFGTDTYSAFLNTVKDASSAGQYEIWLEVFDAAGNPVTPGPGTFEFIVPENILPDQSVEARAADSTEVKTETIDGKTHVGFVFNLHIDNDHCTASIDAPNIEGVTVADKCGFLRYNKKDNKKVTIAFHAQHPDNFATFIFNVHRGGDHLAAVSTLGEVSATTAGAYTGDGVGDFHNDFNRSDLLCGPADPTDCCDEAAFAERVYVYAKATRGHGHRITAYDAAATRAFALAPNSK